MKNGARVSIAKDLKRMRKKLSRLAPRVQKKWDPDELHDLRVLTRRLRAIVWLSRHSAKGPRLKELRQVLRDLGHALGEKRTLDVLEKDAEKYKVSGKPKPGDLKKAKKQIVAQLESRQTNGLNHLLRAAEKKLSKLQSRDLQPALAELIVRLEKLGEHKPKNPKEWHLLRIEVKKVRYAAELLGVKVGELKTIQDLLGRGHDLGLLMERSGRNPKIHSDLQKVWKRSEKITAPHLKKSERKLLACRK
jgi:CHAD domain-containing protein